MSIFLFFGIMATISIIRTIVTPPGSIPEEDQEWDMISEESEEKGPGEEDEVTEHEAFLNDGIESDADDPKEPSHLDYKYIKSEAGPIY